MQNRSILDAIAPKENKVKAWDKTDWGKEYEVTYSLDNAKASNLDALILPGGIMNPDELRQITKAIAFAEHFIDNHKPIAAICHAAQSLIETRKLKNCKFTSYPSLKTSLINAGANWVDEEVVVDNNLTTNRSAADLDT